MRREEKAEYYTGKDAEKAESAKEEIQKEFMVRKKQRKGFRKYQKPLQGLRDLGVLCGDIILTRNTQVFQRCFICFRLGPLGASPNPADRTSLRFVRDRNCLKD